MSRVRLLLVSEGIVRIADRHSHRGDPPVLCRPYPQPPGVGGTLATKREHSAFTVDQTEPRDVWPRPTTAASPVSLGGAVEPFDRDQYPELEPAHATTTIAMASGVARAISPAPMRSVILPIVCSPVVGGDEWFERR